ncbi:MAG: DNA/RNA nuclease SfsA [Pseudomonadaceae bacterium]|nr:DNA/RNA nuclease SfsA [Pseudomonadaceae bacterium]
MKFEPALQKGVLVRRYKRFLADVETETGLVTMHCPNTGGMLGCSDPGSRVWFSTSDNKKRKYAHTLEVVEARDGCVGVNPSRANALVEEAIRSGVVQELDSGCGLIREIAIPDESGRFDLALGAKDAPLAFIEVKSVTLHLQGGVGAFPDAVSERAVKHVQALQRVAQRGTERAVLMFCVQHEAVTTVVPADEIHPAYGTALRAAAAAGVEVLAYGVALATDSIEMRTPLRVDLSD